MSVVIVTYVTLPTALTMASGLLAAAATAAAASMGLRLDNEGAAGVAAENSVDLCIGNADEAVSGLSAGQSMTFRGDGVTLTFYYDEDGRAAVKASGRGSEAELRALGETMAKRVVQQYAYHRIVMEMRARDMNIVDEEVEADGTVRMRVRVHQG